ncbi:MAG: AtpZ/AtpI family protein [Syntrophomonadaceae bacterium]|jgi:ATP synthase protein I
MTERQKKHWARALSDAINMVTTTAAAIALCGYGGYWLDNKLGTNGWLTIGGVLLGIATGIKVMWDKMPKSSKPYHKDGENEK